MRLPVLYSIEDVHFAYPRYPESLSGVTFNVQPGERVVLLGANGSGKSTLLHLMDGLYYPTQGRITVMGAALTEQALEQSDFGPRFRKEVGFLFQNSDAQLFCPTVEEEIAFAPLQLRLPKDEIRTRIEDTLKLLNLEDLRDRPPQTLSAGQKKRVALASLLAVGPSVLLLDEPTAGLDPRSQHVLLDLLGQLAAAGVTLVTATHDLALVPHLADRALVLSEEHSLVADRDAIDILSDTELLLSVNLVHAHAHEHEGLVHVHPHQHVIAHDHEH
ncbi:MAG TPA: ABC transporter ATP-binding protein [Armatimonadota bacterium]|jgi:cobalt/nickel transport system ATP-binding protein